MDALIVGSGPAAVGTALGLLTDPEVKVTVLDVGASLEDTNEIARQHLSAVGPEAWDRSELSLISRAPVQTSIKGLPQKRSFGSDFPFRDLGQLEGLESDGGVNRDVISGAYGGFSNVWGAQVMPFTAATFTRWPFSATDMQRHYASILREIPFAAEHDDLEELFPLLQSSVSLPRLSQRTRRVLARYAQHRRAIRARGVTVGRARLAFAAEDCVRCGLCLTGCPYHLIYSAAQSMTRLRQTGRVSYRGGQLALRVTETESHASVTTRHLQTGRIEEIRADRVFVACGGIGTSRLIMTSLEQFGQPRSVAESVQFMLPFLSATPVADPLQTPDFTLNQFNIVVDTTDTGLDLAQLHLYTFDQAFVKALPRSLSRERLVGLRSHALRRVSVALGYLPSWVSPSFNLVAQPPRDAASLSSMKLSAGSVPESFQRSTREVLRRLVAVAPRLDIWPVFPALQFSAPGKSYHWGGGLPPRPSSS